jgi:mannose-6-phosphate isomerase-like protein (cupin superfamily)
MATQLTLTPSERLVVRSATAEVLEVEATYDSHGSPPPAHLHPAQDEHFEVLAGALRTRVDGRDRTLEPGQTLDVPRGVAHQMWNDGAEPARVRWTTSPAGRTLDWFRTLDAYQRSGRVGGNGMPGPLAFAVVLTEFRDVFRLATPVPAPLVQGALALLAPLGRLRGYEARASEESPSGT